MSMMAYFAVDLATNELNNEDVPGYFNNMINSIVESDLVETVNYNQEGWWLKH